MKKLILGILANFLILCLGSTACAVEPPVIDYEGFAADLMEQGIMIPQTMEEAIGDTSFSFLPEYELTVDAENEQFILRTSLITEDVDLISSDYSLFTSFTMTDEPGVYVGNAASTCRIVGDSVQQVDSLGDISEYSMLRMITRHEKDPNVFPLWYAFDLETGRCEDYRTEEYVTDTIYISKMLWNYGNGNGSFEVDIADQSRSMTLGVEYDIQTGKPNGFSFYDGENDVYVIFQDKSISQLWVGEYEYFRDGYDEWEIGGQPCEAPFEVTPDLYPYPSFLP